MVYVDRSGAGEKTAMVLETRVRNQHPVVKFESGHAIADRFGSFGHYRTNGAAQTLERGPRSRGKCRQVAVHFRRSCGSLWIWGCHFLLLLKIPLLTK